MAEKYISMMGEHAPQMHDVAEEHRQSGQHKAHAQAEQKQRQKRVHCQHHSGVQRRAGENHHNNQRHKAEHAVHKRKAHLLQREDVFGNVHLFDEQAAPSMLDMALVVASLKKR